MIFERNLPQMHGCSLNPLPGLLSHLKTHREVTSGKPEVPNLVPTDVPTPWMLVRIQTSGCFSVEAGSQTTAFRGSCLPAAIFAPSPGAGLRHGGQRGSGGLRRDDRPMDLPAGGGNCRADFNTNTYPTLTGHFPWGNVFFPCVPHSRPSPSSAPLTLKKLR